MASQHLVSRKSASRPRFSGRLDRSGAGPGRLAHLRGKETTAQRRTTHGPATAHGLDPVVTTS
jgi:hypothetical protein